MESIEITYIFTKWKKYSLGQKILYYRFLLSQRFFLTTPKIGFMNMNQYYLTIITYIILSHLPSKLLYR